MGALPLSGEVVWRTLAAMGQSTARPASSSRFAICLCILPAGWHAVSRSVIAGGTLAVVAADVDLPAAWARLPAGADPASRAGRVVSLVEAATALVLTWEGEGWREALRVPLEGSHLRVDRFPDGGWLLVGAGLDGKENARVLAPDGTITARFTLGRNVEHAAVDAGGRIWVGWSDEGIYGNSDWTVPGREWPPSSRGIACFDAAGALLPLPDLPSGVETISDCYALAAVGDAGWACTYTGFPLLRLHPGAPMRWWSTRLAGPKALAVDGSHALVAGGYCAQANRLALISLEGVGQGEQARVRAMWTLPLHPLPASANKWDPVWEEPTLLTGRDDALHLIAGDVWHRWRVADLLADLHR